MRRRADSALSFRKIAGGARMISRHQKLTAIQATVGETDETQKLAVSIEQTAARLAAVPGWVQMK